LKLPEKASAPDEKLLEADGIFKMYPISTSAEMINPNMQRLDYVAGLETTHQKYPGIFYSFFGGVMSSCDDAYHSFDTTFPHVIGNDDFSILCRNKDVVGYLGHDAVNTAFDPAKRIISGLAIDDSFQIRDSDYPDIVKQVNRLVVFDSTGTPRRYLKHTWKDRTRVGGDKASINNIHVMVNNENPVPLFLWQGGRSSEDIQTNLGHWPSKGNLQSLYLSPNSQLELKIIFSNSMSGGNVGIVGTSNTDLSKNFEFEMTASFGRLPNEDLYGRIGAGHYISSHPDTDLNRLYVSSGNGAMMHGYDQNITFVEQGSPYHIHDGYKTYRFLDKEHTYPDGN